MYTMVVAFRKQVESVRRFYERSLKYVGPPPLPPDFFRTSSLILQVCLTWQIIPPKNHRPIHHQLTNRIPPSSPANPTVTKERRPALTTRTNRQKVTNNPNSHTPSRSPPLPNQPTAANRNFANNRTSAPQPQQRTQPIPSRPRSQTRRRRRRPCRSQPGPSRVVDVGGRERILRQAREVVANSSSSCSKSSSSSSY